jgi:signal transduction histidine kinase
VRLHFCDGPTTLTILNPLVDGDQPVQPGLETANGGYGLAGMRERLRLIDGSLDAHATGANWVVTAQVPK